MTKEDDSRTQGLHEAVDVLENIHPLVQSIITKANRIFLEGFYGNALLKWKKGGQLSTASLTETDLKLDQYLREQISVTFPNMSLITEEQEEESQKNETWIIDPLDGTANFANKIPIAGISIALWRENKPIYGILSFPLENETVHAVSGRGVFYNGEPVSFRDSGTPPHLGTLFTGVGSNEDKLRIVNRMTKVVPFPTNYQCASFHLKTLALHRADCGVFMNMPIWDIAAGVVITEEAGLSNIFITETSSVWGVNLRGSRNTVIIGNRNLALKVTRQIQEGI